MLKSKLADIFFSLSKTQQRSLRKFLQSPYYNHRQDVLDLFEILQAADVEDRTALQKERVFELLFPQDTQYDADKLDYVMSFLMKLTEQFLATEYWQQEQVWQQLALAEHYRHLNLEKHFQQSIQQARKLHQRLPFRDIDYMEKATKIEMEDYAFSAKQKRHAPRNLQYLSDLFDLQYLAQRLRYSCLLIAHQSVYKTEYEMGTLATAIDYIEKTPKVLEHPAVALYYYYYRAVTDKRDIVHFRLFKDHLLQHTEQLQKPEMYDLYIFAINYCIQQFNSGNDALLAEVFQLYKSGLEHQILLDNGRMSAFAFKNIADIALRLNETQWTERFIQDYKGLLEDKIRETYMHYALSKLRYHQRRYRDAMLHLQSLEQGDLFLVISGKVLLAKIYYELEEIDAMEALLSSFQIFLHRKKELPQTRRDNYKTIIKFMRKLVNVNPYDASEKQKLAEEIRQTRQLTEKDWLLEQLK